MRLLFCLLMAGLFSACGETWVKVNDGEIHITAKSSADVVTYDERLKSAGTQTVNGKEYSNIVVIYQGAQIDCFNQRFKNPVMTRYQQPNGTLITEVPTGDFEWQTTTLDKDRQICAHAGYTKWDAKKPGNKNAF